MSCSLTLDAHQFFYQINLSSAVLVRVVLFFLLHVFQHGLGLVAVSVVANCFMAVQRTFHGKC
jgi:hypothetical protein